MQTPVCATMHIQCIKVGRVNIYELVKHNLLQAAHWELFTQSCPERERKVILRGLLTFDPVLSAVIRAGTSLGPVTEKLMRRMKCMITCSFGSLS